jgi:hypothetical protein
MILINFNKTNFIFKLKIQILWKVYHFNTQDTYLKINQYY